MRSLLNKGGKTLGQTLKLENRQGRGGKPKDPSGKKRD
jgi:hypothetical protein